MKKNKKNLLFPTCHATDSMLYYAALRAMKPLRRDEDKDMDMTIIEAMDYIKDYDIDGITLTESGRGAAEIILAKRAGWTPTHALMLERIRSGVEKLPLKLARTVSRTRLGDALDLVRDITKEDRRKQKSKLRRKAAKARRRAAMEGVAA